MNISFKTFWLPKLGNSFEEYEDAFYPEQNLENEISEFDCAIADGATETSFSKIWAKLLVKQYCSINLNEGKNILENLSKIQNEWKEQFKAIKLPWYAEEKLMSGAFSSLVGLSLKNCENIIKWNAIAIGDSCLFQIRKGELILSFPLKNSNDFNNRPLLISTNNESNSRLEENLFIESGEIHKNDIFYLMTDALACWFLKEIENGEKPCEYISTFKLEDQSYDFKGLINSLREEGKLRNDDVTFICLEILGI